MPTTAQRSNEVSVLAASYGGRIEVRWSSESPGVTLSFSRAGKTLLKLRQTARSGRKVFLTPKGWKRGSYLACAASGGAVGDYLPARGCSQMRLR